MSLTAAADILEFEGEPNGAGNSSVSINQTEYDGINVHLKGNITSLNSDTTEALVFRKDVTVSGEGKTVFIANTVQSPKIDNNGGIYARDQATINFTDLDSVYIAAIAGGEDRNDSTAISAKTPYRGWSGLFDTYQQNNTVNISAKTVQLIGSIDVTTTVFHEGVNKVTVKLSGEDSFWYGSAIGEGKDSIVDITLENGATWIFNASGSLLNQDGELSNLTLNKGVVVLADEKVWETYENTVIKGTDFVLANYRDRDSVYATVELTNLKGTGGTFLMDLDWRANQGQKTYAKDGSSDFIQIGTVQDGSHQFVEFDAGKAHLDEMTPGDKLYFASVESGSTSFSTNADGEVNRADELYVFDYSTQSELDAEKGQTYWFLTKSLAGTNENASLLKSAALASYSLATDLDRLNERRGQSRHANRGEDGLWVRYRYSSVGMDGAFDMDKHMIQVGYDKDVSTSESRKIVGAAFDYTRGDADPAHLSGSGDLDRYGLNLYYTVLADCGGYADFSAKIGRIGSDYDAVNSAGQDIGASFWQTYYGVSAEFGYKYDLTPALFAEPQVQVQAMRIEGDNFTTEGGVKAQINDANSLIGRLGFRAGYQFSFGETLPESAVYVVADVLHEFNGDAAFRALGATTSYDYERSGHETWYDAGLGADISLTRNAKLWLDSKYVFGGDFENTWALNAGVRFEF